MARPAVDRLRLILDDTLRFHPLSRSLVARGIESRAGKVTAGTSTDFAKAIDQLGRAARITPSEKQRRRIEQRMRDLTARLRREDLDWDAVMADIKEAEIKKGVILKPPVSAQEKGVLLIAFEQHWVRLLRYADLDKVARDYHLVVGPTWSPPHDLPIMLAGHFWPGPLVHLLSNFDDQQVFGRLLDDSVAVPLLSSSWVDPTLFATDEPVAKEYDIVMLANFATYKRHFSFFRMLKKLPRETKVLLLGRPLRDRSEATIRYEASLAGVEDRITIKQGLPD